MIKPFLIVLLLLVSIKMGFASDQCETKSDGIGPIVEIRNPLR